MVRILWIRTTTHTLYDHTDGSGKFSFFVELFDAAPGGNLDITGGGGTSQDAGIPAGNTRAEELSAAWALESARIGLESLR